MGAEHLLAEVRPGDIHQTPGLHADMAEGLHIGGEGLVVVGAGGHVAPVGRRDGAAGDVLEVHDLQGVLGRGEGRGRAGRGELPRQGPGRRGEHGAGREELKEPPATGRRAIRLDHTHPRTSA